MTTEEPRAEGGETVGPAEALQSGEALESGEALQSSEALELLAIVERLEGLLERADLSELEVGSGGTAFVLRRHVASPVGIVVPEAVAVPAAPAVPDAAPRGGDDDASSGGHAILAPLTGLFYTSPSPGADPYVRVGGPVNVGQVIGLIEAMKLFNEIKSDVSGTVTRIAAESGTLVKQKQPLIEVQPS
jgi:acetyl-CoA carboxylase biotin carboxyl carrier protein